MVVAITSEFLQKIAIVWTEHQVRSVFQYQFLIYTILYVEKFEKKIKITNTVLFQLL